MKILSALAAGVLFGLGLTISQMVNPAKVLGFLDVFGNWDPSLAFVMGGALLTTMVGYRLAWTQPRPLFNRGFALPTSQEIDARLIGGAVLFGLGWGLVGLCPGPAVAALSIGGGKALMFFAAMLVGMGVFEVVERRTAQA